MAGATTRVERTPFRVRPPRFPGHANASPGLARSALFLATLSALLAGCQPPRHERVEFTRMLAHWAGYADEGYVPFVIEAKAQVAQVGFYGASFYSLAQMPEGKGYPMNLPLVGLRENAEFFRQLNARLHAGGVKVVGHMNVKYIFGDPDGPSGPRGFFKWYRDLWDEKDLGPKPVADPLELLERDADGKPIVSGSYSIGGMKEYWGCLNNPHWKAVLKAWVRSGIRHGADGFVANYFYRHDCSCRYCQEAFRQYLGGRFTPGELKEKFGIEDLPRHLFKEIVSWHDPKTTTPLRLEMLRFSQIANKRAFDEVFIDYGRSLAPNLIVAQWNHLGQFVQISGDERSNLPDELWGKGEDYLWYSTGDAANYTDLAAGRDLRTQSNVFGASFLGEGTLQARYIRGAFDDKPFTLGKYEQTRIRATIAELAANGGAPMGFYTNFTDPAARREIVRYYGFLARYDEVFRANRPHAEALLLYPRSAVHRGDLAAVETFQKLGYQLLDGHVLFDVLPDDLATAKATASYKCVIRAEGGALPSMSGLSTFKAPQTVRVSASRPEDGKALDVHFVNYNRTEPVEKHSRGGGIADEKPIPAPPIEVDLVLPPGLTARRVTAMTPESPEPVVLPAQVVDGRARFTVPSFLVYGIVRVE